MNSFVIFEAILAVSCLISVNLMRQAFFPASLFWAFGAATFAIAATLGAFKFAGFAGIESYYTPVKYFAGSAGLAAFALGAVSGLFSGFFSRFYWPILILLALALSGVLLFGYWRMPVDIQKIVVGIIFLVGVIRLFSSAGLAIYLILGVGCLLASNFLVKWMAVHTGMEAMNIYHILLSLGVVSFGVAASRDGWE